MGYLERKANIEYMFQKFGEKTGISIDIQILEEQIQTIEDMCNLNQNDDKFTSIVNGLVPPKINIVYSNMLKAIVTTGMELGDQVKGNPFRELNALMEGIYEGIFKNLVPEDQRDKFRKSLFFTEDKISEQNALARKYLNELDNPIPAKIAESVQNGTFTTTGTMNTLKNSLDAVNNYLKAPNKQVALAPEEKIATDKFSYKGEREAVQELATNIRIQEAHYKSRSFLSRVFLGRAERKAIKTAKKAMENYARPDKDVEATINENLLPGNKSAMLYNLTTKPKDNTVTNYIQVSKEYDDMQKDNAKQTEQEHEKPEIYDFEKLVEYVEELAKTATGKEQLVATLKKHNEEHPDRVKDHILRQKQIDAALKKYNEEHPDNQIDYQDKYIFEKEKLYEDIFQQKFVCDYQQEQPLEHDKTNLDLTTAVEEQEVPDNNNPQEEINLQTTELEQKEINPEIPQNN